MTFSRAIFAVERTPHRRLLTTHPYSMSLSRDFEHTVADTSEQGGALRKLSSGTGPCEPLETR
jgi:hypothetical protein